MTGLSSLVSGWVLSAWNGDTPYKANPDGSCEKLIDNRCSVYDDRPLMCDIGRMADEMNLPMSKEKWFDMNYEGCKRLQMEIL